MHLELMRTTEKDFPNVPDPQLYTTARIWHCKYRTLAPIATFTSLRKLEIATYPDSTLAHLSKLVNLEDLRILHLPHISDLSPLAALKRLRRLALETLPSWDPSGKVTTVHTLVPLSSLASLEEVNLLGVRPVDGRVDALIRNQRIRQAKLHGYPKAEVERLRLALAARNGG